MQMESWRERGFVPDSDDEDGFESQEKEIIDEVSLIEISRPAEVETAGDGKERDGVTGEGRDDAHDARLESDIIGNDGEPVAAAEEDVGLPLPAPDQRSRTPTPKPNDDNDGDGSDLGVNGERRKDAHDNDLGAVSEDEEARKGDGDIVESNGGSGVDEDNDLPLPERPQTPDGHENCRPDFGNDGAQPKNVRNNKNEPPSTPRPKQNRDFWDIPNSSPDLLQADHHPWRKRTSPAETPTPKAKNASQLRPQVHNVEDSPPTSPLSSVRSSVLDENSQQLPEDPPNQPLEANQTIQELLDNIPDDVLQELDQPARRSLRQRNPIQLHPYQIEDAKYQRLMRARGVKPVRISQQELQRARAAAEESQARDLGNDTGSSSDTQMSGYPPSSPVDTREQLALLSRNGSTDHGTRAQRAKSPNTGPRSPKRHRVIGPEDDRRRQALRPVPRPVSPQVVIYDASSSMPPTASSVFDMPSPPPSGSVSSPPAREDTGFRFPRGFSPPTITPRTETRRGTKDIDHEPINLDEHENEVDRESDDSQSVRSASPNGRPTSDMEGDEQEDPEEAAVRRYQRKIKGVLPASWLRLDQQKQRPIPSATQRKNERMARLETEAAKGIARKITRKPDFSTPSSARDQLSSLRQLADDSDQESAENSDDNDDLEGHRQLANMIGLDDTFLDQNFDGDIPEDNRIDYMFPTESRNRTLTNRHKPAKKRKRPENDGAGPDDLFKKPRRKRQARLTTAVYGGQEKKRPSRSLPRLGILDAPDVASQPRKEQPQFLRVAARKARFRQDRGRRSPSRKVIKLNSRLDTEDANVSLREWRAGRLRQTTLPSPQSQAPPRQPLRELSTNARDVFNSLRAKKASERTRAATRPTAGGNNSAVGENVPTVDVPPTSRSSARDTATRAIQQRQGNTWIIQRNLAITSLSRNNPRPVIPENESHGSTATASSLQRSLAQLGRDERLPLNRFLSGGVQPQTSVRATADLAAPKPALRKPATEQRRRQLKKRQPKRVDITHIEDYAIPVSSSPEERSLEPRNKERSPHGTLPAQLNRFRTAYSVDFDVRPLPGGMFFHESTFIGSGEFFRALEIAKRDLDTRTNFLTVTVGDQSMQWGAWDDSVSSQLGAAFDQILKFAETGRIDEGPGEQLLDATDFGCATYRSLVKYASEALSFIDPVDRTGFVARANSLIAKVMEDLSMVTSATGNVLERPMRIASYNVVFASQVYHVACHPLVNQAIHDEALGLAKLASKQVITLVSSSTGQAGVRKFLAASKLRELRERGIKDDHPVVEACVIVQNVLRSADRFRVFLEEYAAEAYSAQGAASTGQKDIGNLEGRWQQVFETLPLQEFDALGISRVGSRFQGGHDNWLLVRRLLRPVFDSDEANSDSQPVSYYSYCRVLFQRCFILINGWGWRDCKPILDTLYDFFAKRTLYNLRLEENYKSPAFLDELDDNPSFDVLPGDPCFHILLKVIAIGLRFLSKAYDKKKIRNYTWRLLPNHGRDYPKEQPIHQTDLDALRNHHDLLCTLYSSVPDGCRPRLETIKALVHPATSHRETCKISLRTWTRLVRFKLSTNEDLSGLEPFAEWHAYFVTEFLKQHSLARREIEAQDDGGKQFSQQLIDRTVAQNQRQIESLLKTALQGLQSAIKSASTLEHAQKILSQTPIKSVLDLFDSRTPRLNATVLEGLQIIIMYVQKCSALSTGSTGTRVDNNPGISADEDSQDYGDWTDIAAAYGYESEPQPISLGVDHVANVFHPAVSRLVSNCFGEDRCPDDAILMNVVDCWTSIAHTLVTHGLRRWDSYISPYESDSWVALRWTTQTRKFTPQFLAKCIEKDEKVFSECRVQILGMWMSSLVERVSMLKFQHRFTEAILNQDTEDAVLKNLPFSKDPKEERYSITFVELSQRRLSLISSLLSNMRAHVQDLDDRKSPELSTTRHEYREIIQQMMSSMKSNYQGLGNGEAEVQGAYVNFVHNIVSFLQQHSRDICPVDSFFTDPASFPLPSDDPTYIVARLRSYEPKLSSAKVAKTLIIFIQSVSERAALDGQQTYFVNQLYNSMTGTYETGSPGQPTLRATLLQGVFPAYLATAFDNRAAWILSRPIIETITCVFQELLFNMDGTDPDCVQSILNILSAIFASSYNSLRRIYTDIDSLNQPHVLITTAASLDMLKATLPVVDYIDRLNQDTCADANPTNSLMTQIRAFQHLAQFIISNVQQSPKTSTLLLETLLTDIMPCQPPTSDISLAATRELKAYINESWSAHQGKYYFTRRGGQQPQEVVIEAPISAMLDDRPGERLVDAATSILDALRKLDLFGGGELAIGEEEIHHYDRLHYERGCERDYDRSLPGEEDLLVL
ncbi:uncharacterized protein BDV17DRAFT_251848 [Aspergillus undulatus]|uniref:uncharacterized protein n=1 Tax=Aspergillus undulatus TaxID=1810928 RepID=UPI003CCDA5CD